MDSLQRLPLYPFRFEPIYKEYAWGGSCIRDCFRRESIPKGKAAESWEIVDHEQGGSVITNGPFAGRPLHEIVTSRPEVGRFPLRLKYVDAEEMVPVQVYPNACQAKAWVVVEAAPESVMYLGLNRHYSPSDAASAIREGRIESLLHKIHPKVGECYLIEPGTIHSLGHGILVAEVQQTGGKPFYLFDWNRKEVPLQIEPALQVIDYQQGTVFSQKPSPTEYRHCQRLVTSAEFTLNRWIFDEMMVWVSDNRYHIWSVLQGSVTAIFHLGRRGTPENLSGRQSDPLVMECLKRGDTLLVPSVCRSVQWSSDSDEPVILLDAFVAEPEKAQ